MIERKDDIDFFWLKRIVLDFKLPLEESDPEEIKTAEKLLNCKFPSDHRLFLTQLNGITDLDGIKILSAKEIIKETDNELLNSQFAFRIIPLAKYLSEYSFLVFDEKGIIYKLEHDNDKLRMKYPDFWSFALLQSLFFIENPFICEDLNLSDAGMEEKIEQHHSVIIEKLKIRNFNFDNLIVPDWSNWKRAGQ